MEQNEQFALQSHILFLGHVAFLTIACSSTTTTSTPKLFQATGGARFGMRAQTRQQAKWKRAESNISAEEEEEVKRKVEWDGMAPPQVLLTAKNESTQPLVEDGNATKKNTTAEVTTTTSTTTTQEKEATKKRRRVR